MSTLRTLAPSFANKAANGLPTTSDLSTISTAPSTRGSSRHEPGGYIPVDHSDHLSPGAVAISQHLVVRADVLEDFDYGEWSAREDGLDCSKGGLVVPGRDGSGRGFGRSGFRQERSDGLEGDRGNEADAVAGG